MGWLRSSWQWKAVNIVGLYALAVLVTQRSVEGPYYYTAHFDVVLESAKWAVRFLLISLAMSPLNTYMGWRKAISLRKPAGLWAFAFAAIHVGLVLTDGKFGGVGWLTFPLEPFIVFGLVGISILTLMAATSNRWAMKRLGKLWKRLHRLVYGAGIAIIIHAILATTSSKRMFINDPNAIDELRIYLAILIFLLIARIPFVRAGIKMVKGLPKRSRVTPDAQLEI